MSMEPNSDIDGIQNNGFDSSKTGSVNNPFLESKKTSLSDRFSGITQRFNNDPVDAVALFRKREELRAAHNPNADVDEGVDQSILREIRDGKGTPEQKQALYTQLSPESQRSTPAPIPGAVESKAPVEEVTQESLQKQKDELMNSMLTDPNEKTQKKIRDIEDQLEKRFGLVPLYKRLNITSNAEADTTPTIQIPVVNKDKGPEEVPVVVDPVFVSDEEADTEWNTEQISETSDEKKGGLWSRLKGLFARDEDDNQEPPQIILPTAESKDTDPVNRSRQNLATEISLSHKNDVSEVVSRNSNPDQNEESQYHVINITDILKDIQSSDKLPLDQESEDPLTVDEAVRYFADTKPPLLQLVRDFRESHLINSNTKDDIKDQIDSMRRQLANFTKSGLRFQNNLADSKRGYAFIDYMLKQEKLIKLAEESLGERKSKSGNPLVRSDNEFFTDLNTLANEIDQDFNEFHQEDNTKQVTESTEPVDWNDERHWSNLSPVSTDNPLKKIA